MKLPAGAGRPVTDLCRPRNAPRGRAPGRDIDRVLLIGAGPAVGWGVTTHDLALPGALARAVSALTHRGCDVDLHADQALDVTGAALVADERDLSRYDAVVLMVGVNEALGLASVHKWRFGMTGLLTTLTKKMPMDSAIIVVGANPIRSLAAPKSSVGPLRARRAFLLDRATLALCAEDPRTTFLSLPGRSAPTSSSPTMALQYVQWAAVIGGELAPRLTTQNQLDRDRRRAPGRPPRIAEADRQKAVDRLRLTNREASTDLQRIVSLAQQAFDVESALLTVLDGDRQWHFATAGREVPEISRTASFCEFAIESDEALVVGDTRDDDRFRDNPLVVGDPHIRFYAGFPIEAGSGRRIGTLCVLDSEPRRRADDINVTLLRELAHLAQRELWKYLPTATAGPTSHEP